MTILMHGYITSLCCLNTQRLTATPGTMAFTKRMTVIIPHRPMLIATVIIIQHKYNYAIYIQTTQVL